MGDAFDPVIEGTIDAHDVKIGRGVVVEADVLLTGKHGPADRIVLGDFCFIGRGTRALVPKLLVGDYTKVHARSFLHGERPMRIGRNCWFGGGVVLDSMGGLDIEDNVGVGAHSQLWTHIRFGDVVEGSRFCSSSPMRVQEDAWFVGQCLVSPVTVGRRSMALLGSVITGEMLPNHVYGGSPARDLTDRVGPQFEDRTVAQKAAAMRGIIEAWEQKRPEHSGRLLVAEDPAERDDDRCWFDVSTRTYAKRLDAAEVAFMRDNVPVVKFAPDGDPPFVPPPTVDHQHTSHIA